MNTVISNYFKKELSDEYYTPPILAAMIEKHLINKSKEIPDCVVWLPFDTDTSEFAFLCKKNNINYITSHLLDGKDFFKYTPDKFDIILSNPPFSLKKEVIIRCVDLDVPFALVHNVMMWNYHEIGDLGLSVQSTGNPLQLLLTNKRISYDGNPTSFGSGYVCRKFLKSDFLFESSDNNNVGKHFRESRIQLDKGLTMKFTIAKRISDEINSIFGDKTSVEIRESTVVVLIEKQLYEKENFEKRISSKVELLKKYDVEIEIYEAA